MLLFLQNLAAFPVTITTFCPPFQARTLTRRHTKRLPPCNRTKAERDRYHLLQHTSRSTSLICVPITAENRRLLLKFQNPQLRSDLQKNLTRTGLTPPPARCSFQINSTVFITACSYAQIRVHYRKKPLNSQGFPSTFHSFRRIAS